MIVLVGADRDAETVPAVADTVCVIVALPCEKVGDTVRALAVRVTVSAEIVGVAAVRDGDTDMVAVSDVDAVPMERLRDTEDVAGIVAVAGWHDSKTPITARIVCPALSATYMPPLRPATATPRGALKVAPSASVASSVAPDEPVVPAMVVGAVAPPPVAAFPATTCDVDVDV